MPGKLEKPFWKSDMEEKLIKQLKQDLEGSDFGSKQNDLLIWYNKEGDCIQFKTKHVATIGRRIDRYLTLYISVEDKQPIGFQLKDIHALFDEYDLDLMAVQADYTSGDKKLVSVTATGLILKAFTKMPESINRFSGYEEAFRTMVGKNVEVDIPLLVS